MSCLHPTDGTCSFCYGTIFILIVSFHCSAHNPQLISLDLPAFWYLHQTDLGCLWLSRLFSSLWVSLVMPCCDCQQDPGHWGLTSLLLCTYHGVSFDVDTTRFGLQCVTLVSGVGLVIVNTRHLVALVILSFVQQKPLSMVGEGSYYSMLLQQQIIICYYRFQT